MSEQLKPCPFCGCSVAVMRTKYPNGEKDWKVYGWHSENCYFKVAGNLCDSTNKRNLIRAWNRRIDNG